MRIGIVGLPQSGKTTLFNLLTCGHASISPWGSGGGAAHLGVAQVPDPRLERLAEIFKPKRVTHATVEYVDLPGLPFSEGRAGLEIPSREMGAYLNSLGNVDALMHVVRAFEDPNVLHLKGTIDPLRDIELLELEMMIADLAIVDKRLERLSKDLKKAKNAELELENAALTSLRKTLESEHPLRELELTAEENRRIKGFTLLSAKPILLLLNLGDGDVQKIPGAVDAFGLQKQAAMPKIAVSAVCGKIESEIAALPEEDARMFMEDLGLSIGGRERIIRESYSLLDILTFFTVNETEARAWTIVSKTTAQQAAGGIHTDMERGFIKAEVVSYSDMVELGSIHAAKSKGVLRLEGKDYPVREGDVILFRFNL